MAAGWKKRRREERERDAWRGRGRQGEVLDTDGGDGRGGGGGEEGGKEWEGMLGKRSRVMGLILAERIIKQYYHNGPVIQPAST